MKKVSVVFVMALLLTTTCQQPPVIEPVDIKAEEATLNVLLDNLATAMRTMDVETLSSFFSDRLFFYGTDPSELWTRQQVTERWQAMSEGDPYETKTIGDRLIIVNPDGLTAIAVDQYYMPKYSQKIPFRNVFYLTKGTDGWKIDFFSASFVPKNEDLPKLNRALE